MSIRTEIDGFSAHLIHAGHGRIHIREDKHFMAFLSRKSFRMWERKRNPRKIAWTEHFRHDHKKAVADTQSKTVRAQRKRAVRGYNGVSIEKLQAAASARAIKARTQKKK